MKAYRFIINPISGIGRQKVLENCLPAAFSGTGKSYTVYYTEGPGHATELTKECLHHGADVVVAVGGDGSLNEVATGLTGNATALGIIPAGSGNGFARHIGMPMNTEKALKALLRGRAVSIDTALFNGRPFFATAGTGYDAQIAHLFAKGTGRGLHNYVKITVREFFKYTPKTYHITIGESTEKKEAFIICAANANQWGNNAFIAPNARLDDGLLDLCVLKKFSAGAIPGVVKDLFTKKIVSNRYYQSTLIKDIIVTSEDPVAWHVDGEPLPFCKEAHISIRPQSLKIIIPNE